MKERNMAVPAVYLFLICNEKILLLNRKNTGYYDGWYSVPAGHVEAGELPTSALVREVKEEIGINVDASKLTLVHTMYRESHDSTGDRVDLFYKLEQSDLNPENCEPHKCDHIKWFSLKSLPENMIQNVRWSLELSERGVIFSELSAKTLLKHKKEYKSDM